MGSDNRPALQRRLRGRGRPRHNVERASSPVRFPKTAWKLAKLQTGAPVEYLLKQLWFCQKRQNPVHQAPALPPIDNAMVEAERQFRLEARPKLA